MTTKQIIIIIIITLVSEGYFEVLLYTYTRKSYIKKAFVNKHDIINRTQTKLIIHVYRWYNRGVITLNSDDDSEGDSH